jgi:DUF4097 and DUF4098 domain-containing protein YvlB
MLPVLAALAVAAPAAAQSPDAVPDVQRIVVKAVQSAVPPAARLRADVAEHVHAYQGRNNGPEQTERFSRKVRIGRDGRVSVSNISGDITVSTGSGDEVSIEAVKRARGDAGQLASVRIEVEERGGAVYVRTTHSGRNDHASVDYTITMPATAGVDVHSVSGGIKVTGIRGSVRAETVSGDVTATDTPKLETAKSVSGDVTLSGVTTDGDLSAGSVSGNVIARAVKVHALDLGSVSGDLTVTDVTYDRLTAKSVSGNVDYTGTINRAGPTTSTCIPATCG